MKLTDFVPVENGEEHVRTWHLDNRVLLSLWQMSDGGWGWSVVTVEPDELIQNGWETEEADAERVGRRAAVDALRDLMKDEARLLRAQRPKAKKTKGTK